MHQSVSKINVELFVPFNTVIIFAFKHNRRRNSLSKCGVESKLMLHVSHVLRSSALSGENVLVLVSVRGKSLDKAPKKHPVSYANSFKFSLFTTRLQITMEASNGK